jgi:hypothetical protein
VFPQTPDRSLFFVLEQPAQALPNMEKQTNETTGEQIIRVFTNVLGEPRQKERK